MPSITAAEEVRGLQFLADPIITVLTAEDLAARVRADIEEEIDPAEIVIDEAFFQLIGILDPGIDLAQAITDLYSEQVAGFYDHETKELVVGGDAEMTALTKIIVVHELIHALADQHFDLSTLTDLDRRGAIPRGVRLSGARGGRGHLLPDRLPAVAARRGADRGRHRVARLRQPDAGLAAGLVR